MKRILLLCFVLSLLLAVGCGGTAEVSEVATSKEHAYFPEMLSQTNVLHNSFVELESGCYYQSSERIYFIPRGSDSAYPLCGKPNCAHRDKNCNAYCGYAFGYYNGALYSVMLNENVEFSLVKMNLDGSNHAEVYQPKIGLSGTYNFIFHDGLVLMEVSGNSAILEEALDHLVVIDLSDFSQTELFTDYFADGSRMSVYEIFNNKLYGFSNHYRHSGEDCHFMEWDMTTGQARKLSDLMLGIGLATETTFYYMESGAGFRELDLTTGEVVDRGLPVEDAFWATYDEELIYLMGNARNNGAEHTLYFLTREYELLGQVELTDNLFYGYVSTDRVYFIDQSNPQTCPITYYIDKADIGSENLTLKPFRQ